MATIITRMKRDPVTGLMVKVVADSTPQNVTMMDLYKQIDGLKKQIVNQQEMQSEIKSLKSKLKEQEQKNYELAHKYNKLKSSIPSTVEPTKEQIFTALEAPETQQVLASNRREVNIVKDPVTGKWMEVVLNKDGSINSRKKPNYL